MLDLAVLERELVRPGDVEPIRSGKQVLKFISDKQPLYVGVDPYNFYIDRDSGDNVAVVATP